MLRTFFLTILTMEVYMNKIKITLIILLGLLAGNPIFGMRKPSEIIKLKEEIIGVSQELVRATRKMDRNKCEILDKKYKELYKELQDNGCDRFLKVTLEERIDEAVTERSWTSRAASWAAEHAGQFVVAGIIGFILRRATAQCAIL